MFNFQFSDGWTIYIWLIAGAAIIIAAGIMLYWAYKNEQFDEDIKYLVFDDKDKDKMSPEEFAKYKEVTKRQEARRQELLAQRAEEEARKRAA